MQIVIDISSYDKEWITNGHYIPEEINMKISEAIANSTPLPEVHGRLGDLDELEQRIRSFVEHDAKITDKYTVTRQRFIVNGIHETPTIIEADNESEEQS